MIRALVYFALVFGAGFVLGLVRVPWLEPLVGDRAAQLIEAPFMLAAIWLAAGFVVRRHPAASRSAHLASGVLALALVLALELTVVLALRGQTLAENWNGRDPVSGAVYVALLGLFAGMPWWRARLRGAR